MGQFMKEFIWSTTMAAKQIVVTGLACLALVALVSGQNCPNGEPYFPNAGTVDEFGCTVGYCSKVCPTGAVTNDGRRVTYRGNVGPKNTGSNGNAGPPTLLESPSIPPPKHSRSSKLLTFCGLSSRLLTLPGNK